MAHTPSIPQPINCYLIGFEAHRNLHKTCRKHPLNRVNGYDVLADPGMFLVLYYKTVFKSK